MFMFFSLFFLFTTLVIFVMNGFRIHSYHGNRILLLYTEMNMYTFYMQYMYSVTSEELAKIKSGEFQETDRVKEVLSAKDFVDLDFGKHSEEEEGKRKMVKEGKDEDKEVKVEEGFGEFEIE